VDGFEKGALPRMSFSLYAQDGSTSRSALLRLAGCEGCFGGPSVLPLPHRSEKMGAGESLLARSFVLFA
jgi:hypothetical protein